MIIKVNHKIPQIIISSKWVAFKFQLGEYKMSDDVEYGPLIYSKGREVEVYRGKLLPQNIQVCIKVIYCSTLDMANETLQETYNMMRFRDVPNIIKIYKSDIAFSDGKFFVRVVMELFKNGDLYGLINRRKSSGFWSDDELIDYLKQLVEVYAFLEERNVAHRDIKPENIFVSDDLKMFIVGDLGSAKEKIDFSSTIAGTPLYLSPALRKAYSNHLAGIPQNFAHNSFKSDVYSLGLTFLFMASLKELGDLTAIASHKENLEKRLNQLQNYPRLKATLQKMLKFEEAERPNFKELKNLLGVNKKCINCKIIGQDNMKKIGKEYVCSRCWKNIDDRLWVYNYVDAQVKCQNCKKVSEKNLCGECQRYRRCCYCKALPHDGFTCFSNPRRSESILNCGVCEMLGDKIGGKASRSNWFICDKLHQYCLVCSHPPGFCHNLCSLLMTTK